MIENLNQMDAIKVAVDIPSGLSANTRRCTELHSP
ncbi:MAG: NAD(P)H-hydrate epimerase [Faecalimonas sp.]